MDSESYTSFGRDAAAQARHLPSWLSGSVRVTQWTVYGRSPADGPMAADHHYRLSGRSIVHDSSPSLFLS